MGVSPKEYPYTYCETCAILSPVIILGALKIYRCKVCESIVNPATDERSRLVWLTKDEAIMRGLPFMRGKIEG